MLQIITTLLIEAVWSMLNCLFGEKHIFYWGRFFLFVNRVNNVGTCTLLIFFYQHLLKSPQKDKIQRMCTDNKCTLLIIKAVWSMNAAK